MKSAAPSWNACRRARSVALADINITGTLASSP
jgi:hypothetical protein